MTTPRKKEVPVTPEIRRLAVAGRKAGEDIDRHKARMEDAAAKRREIVHRLADLRLPSRQIADLLGISETAVYQIRHRRKVLSKRHADN